MPKTVADDYRERAAKCEEAAEQERKLLEAELFSLDAQVRHFERIRDRLAAVGKDGVAHRKMQARRDEIGDAKAAGIRRLVAAGLLTINSNLVGCSRGRSAVGLP